MTTFNQQDILIECVPNFSEGRNKATIDAIANAIAEVKDVKLLHIDIGYDANRTVFTFVGKPEAVVDAAYNAIHTAFNLIDMTQHHGAHPRMGACDVCPLIPLQNISMEATKSYSYILAEKVGSLGVPVYMYEASAMVAERSNLAYIRSGEYEAIEEKKQIQEWQPDFGSFLHSKQFGMMAIGARKFLLAYNVNLQTTDIEIGKKIAKIFRADRKTNEKLKYSKAIAWYMEAYNCVQISTNITDFEQSSIFYVFDYIKYLSNKFGIATNGSELIGLIPKQALLRNNNINEVEDLNAAVAYLGLDALHPFLLQERILEYLL